MSEPAAHPWDYPAPFILPVTPQAGDIDAMRHVNNAVYVHWCESAAWGHSTQFGLAVEDFQRLDRAMIIRRAEYDYIQPAHRDDTLQLATWLTGSDGKLTLERRFQLVRESDHRTLMRGRWDLLCIEISTGRPRRMPPEFMAYQHVLVGAKGLTEAS